MLPWWFGGFIHFLIRASLVRFCLHLRGGVRGRFAPFSISTHGKDPDATTFYYIRLLPRLISPVVTAAHAYAAFTHISALFVACLISTTRGAPPDDHIPPSYIPPHPTLSALLVCAFGSVPATPTVWLALVPLTCACSL